MRILRNPHLLLLVLLAGLCPVGAPAQSSTQTATLLLELVDAESGAVVPGGRVAIMGSRLGAVTDSAGNVRIMGVPLGTHLVEARRVGYATQRLMVEFQAGKAVVARVAMVPQPMQLEAVTVEAERRNRQLTRNGFYERKQYGRGSFVTFEDIERSGAFRLSDLLRGVRGVEVVSVAGGYAVVATRGPRSLSGGTCTLQVWVDNAVIELNDIDEVPLPDVSAVEVYAGSSEAPLRFGGTGGACGSVVIWTKDGQ